MAIVKNKLRDELREHKLELNLLQKKPCSKQENKEYQQLLKNGGVLPDGVYAYVYDNGVTSTHEFYTTHETDLTESEIKEYLAYKQFGLIRTIKKCVLFFTVLAIIEIVFSFFLMLLTVFS